MLVLDSGAVTKLAQRRRQAVADIAALRRRGLWPAVVPTTVVVESVTGRSGPDANTNRLLRTCRVEPELTEAKARRAAQLRHLAQKGSAVDAVVVALAEPDGHVLTGDESDLRALAAHADAVVVTRI